MFVVNAAFRHRIRKKFWISIKYGQAYGNVQTDPAIKQTQDFAGSIRD